MDLNTSTANSSNKAHNTKLTQDEITLHLIASGFTKLAQDIENGQALALPYPDSLQHGFNCLVATCLRQGKKPPQSIPHLFQWGHKPLVTWPLNLPPDSIETSDTLLLENLPTQICQDWARASADVEAEISQNKLFYDVYTTCRSANDQAAYIAFRRLLIEQPVLTALELQKQQRLHIPRLADQLAEAYQSAPPVHLLEGRYHCCAHCHNLLLQTTTGKWVCENERCREKGRRPQSEQTFDPVEGVLWLKRGLRRFISVPGLAELHLVQKLKQKGLQVELWPAFDEYDLRVVFSDREAWAIDVKDWANPFLLGRSVKPIPNDPPWSKAFFVFPNERGQQRADYVRAFNSYCKHTKGWLERDFMKQINRKLTEIIHA